ncbi:MAG: endonuclease MutS2 [Phycisphaerae bacterium]
MNETTIDKLEFERICEALADCCATSLGKKQALSLSPTRKPKLVRQWLRQAEELMAVAEEASLPPMGGIHDVREQVRATAFPAPLEPEALAAIAETLSATAHLCTWFDRIVDRAPSLAALRWRVSDLSFIAEVINEAIDAKGDVRDYATPKLAHIRSSIESTRSGIRNAFDRIIRQRSLARYLQYGGATFHGDRMVLPLKAEHRGRISGIIHRTSDSGSTLFVEPSESVELNNTIMRLREQESKEVTRVLRMLSQRIAANTTVILQTLQAVAALDLIAGKCRYAKQRNCTCPTISDDGVLDIHEARHPVLLELFDAEEPSDRPSPVVVPIDVRLGDDFDVLIITGPNTGGKTVSLKTVGLMALMTQCGIPIPAGAGSTMPVYHDIFTDIGDEQSLQQSLSTFSSHLTNLLAILNQSGPRTLVLIDELGAGTDPDEGAAIGRAIIAEIMRLGSHAMVSTHLSALKAVAFTTRRVDNAAVEFDPQSLKPTYRLRMGEPGNSNALIIAKRLGMPARLVQLAKGFLADESHALNEAIKGTLQSRRQAEQARKLAREAALAAEQSRREHVRQKEELKKSQEAFQQWADWVNSLGPKDQVYIKSLKRPARVVRMQFQKQTALVSSGSLDIEVPLNDIDPPRPESP